MAWLFEFPASSGSLPVENLLVDGGASSDSFRVPFCGAWGRVMEWWPWVLVVGAWYAVVGVVVRRCRDIPTAATGDRADANARFCIWAFSPVLLPIAIVVVVLASLFALGEWFAGRFLTPRGK